MQRVLITGGTGFVGTAIQCALAGRPIRVLARGTEVAGTDAGPAVEMVRGDVTDPTSLKGVVDGCDAVIHLVAIISEEGNVTFDRVIRQGTENVLAEAQLAGVTRFLHMSAIGARNDPHYGYFSAKYQAEQAVRASGLQWTILRPSVIFGPGDEFITTLARLVRLAPVVPVVGSGQSKFQPIAVDQVARSFVRALDDPATIGQVYEVGGGKVYTYEQMIDLLGATMNRPKPKVHVPVGLMRTLVQLSKPLPAALRPPVTEEQLKMLAVDNVTDQSATAELTGQPALLLEDGIDYIKSVARR